MLSQLLLYSLGLVIILQSIFTVVFISVRRNTSDGRRGRDMDQTAVVSVVFVYFAFVWQLGSSGFSRAANDLFSQASRTGDAAAVADDGALAVGSSVRSAGWLVCLLSASPCSVRPLSLGSTSRLCDEPGRHGQIELLRFSRRRRLRSAAFNLVRRHQTREASEHTMDSGCGGARGFCLLCQYPIPGDLYTAGGLICSGPGNVYVKRAMPSWEPSAGEHICPRSRLLTVLAVLVTRGQCLQLVRRPDLLREANYVLAARDRWDLARRRKFERLQPRTTAELIVLVSHRVSYIGN